MGKHISTHGVLENALGNAAKIFDGEIVFAEELMKISFQKPIYQLTFYN